jgi:FkbM family methyltransferase
MTRSKIVELFDQGCDLSLKVRKVLNERLLKKQGQLLIFGCGALGAIILERFKQHGIRPQAFVDNHANCQGKKHEGIRILSLEDALEEFPEALVIVGIYTNKPVLEQLARSGVDHITFPELVWGMPEIFMPFCSVEFPDKIVQSRDNILKMADLWADEESEKEFLGQIEWRLTLDAAVLPPHRPAGETYFAEDLFTISEDEVFVDCGSYDGDSIREFIRRSGGKFRHIVAVEPDPFNRVKIEQWKDGMNPELARRFTVVPEAAGDHEGVIRFDAQGSVASTVGSGDVEVHCSRLDVSLGDLHPTFIKMDIEGAEPSALRGTERIIAADQPVLAVCLYHAQEHLWELPLLIHALNPSYKLYLRRYSDDCWETVCYAIPAGRSLI